MFPFPVLSGLNPTQGIFFYFEGGNQNQGLWIDFQFCLFRWFPLFIWLFGVMFGGFSCGFFWGFYDGFDCGNAIDRD